MAEVVELSRDELEAAKRYMRIEGGEEDLTVNGLVLAAREYLDKAGVALPEPGSSRRGLYDLACHSLALSWYDNRDLMTAGQLGENPALRRVINQLKLTEPPVSTLDTGVQEVTGDAGNESP